MGFKKNYHRGQWTEHSEGCCTESPRASEVKASVVKIGGKDKECICDPKLVAL